MKRDGSELRLSATDLAQHLGCRHLTSLEWLAAHGRREPPRWRDPVLETLQQRGLVHERAYLAYLRDGLKLGVVELGDAAAAQCARSLVLLGDPQQLEQPMQGSHPEGADASALEHLLRGAETLPDDRGLFLAETWRLPPPVCAFTSEQFYESRLAPRRGQGLEQQRISGSTPFDGVGLWLAPEDHTGNQSSSPEEVVRITGIVRSLLGGDALWTDRHGSTRPLALDDILVIAPYNAQVSALTESLPDGARVGTVDRFQGQEAPVVVYSMTTSSPEDAPRGMDFLYSRHRFNVATSRAQAVCIVVASPRLLEPACRTPAQMRLANALCRYAELTTGRPDAPASPRA